MNADHPRSVLIIHPGGLGDVLLSLPAIASIRRRYRGHHLVLLARSDIGSLFDACGVVDRTLSMESRALASLMGGAEQADQPLRQLLKSCEYVVGWLRDPDNVVQTTLRELGISRISLGAPTPGKGLHQSQGFFQVLEEAACGDGGPSQLVIPETVREAGRRCLRTLGIQEGQRYVVCHPGSGSFHKCVQPPTMAEVIRSLQQQQAAPVIVGGPADEAAVGRVRDCGLQNVPVIQGQDLTTVAGVLAGADLFVGHDSGLTHLAATAQVPTVTVFGPTDPRRWAPLGAHVAIVTGASCSCSTWDQVRACDDKPCLSMPSEAITAGCSSMLSRYRPVTKS